MEKWIEAYLEDRAGAWSETTLKSETSRLKKLAPLMKHSPAEIYKQLLVGGRKVYTIKTDFMRMRDLESWARDKGYITSTPIKDFMTKAANKFKYAYQKEDLDVTYEEARKRIMTLEDPYRSMALGMLKTGVRISEAYKIKDGKVVGKGNKPRRIFGTIKSTAPKATFWRHLRRIGLKPHMLRKLCATKLANEGATAADLCKIFGWSNIHSAYVYLQGKDDERLSNFIEEATKE